jgi:arylsulfatase A-like enzyme
MRMFRTGLNERQKFASMRVLFAAMVLTVYLASFKNIDTKNNHVEVKKRPNVIFILADQWRAQSTGHTGDPNLIGKTLNLDKLASQAVNFKNAISVTPVCTPYRAALMTGKYPTTTGMIFNDIQLPDEAVTMGELFRDAGYNTGYIGKWHLDGAGRSAFTPADRRQGFEYWKALECSHDYNSLLYYEGNNREKKYWEGYGPYAETKDAISYIRNNAESTKPFFLVLAWGAPHFPHASAPMEFQNQFPKEKIIIRGNVPDSMQEAARKESVGYYAHMMALDKCIGDLQKAIAESGQSENTIIVFTSDHGEMMGSHGVSPRQKQVPWAESVKIPFLLSYPARYGKKRIEVDAPINVIDVLPTLLSVAGLPVPGKLDGENMAGVIDNPNLRRDKAALVMNVSPFAGKADEYRGIYTNRYAYVKTLHGPWLLFDHKNDPLQMNNLVNKPGFQQLQNEMEVALQKELKKAGDDFKPRQFYIDKWGYTLKNGAIDYAEHAQVQGPAINKER